MMGKIKGFLPLREGEGGKGQARDERDGRGKGGEGGLAVGGIMLQGLRGDRRMFCERTYGSALLC